MTNHYPYDILTVLHTISGFPYDWVAYVHTIGVCRINIIRQSDVCSHDHRMHTAVYRLPYDLFFSSVAAVYMYKCHVVNFVHTNTHEHTHKGMLGTGAASHTRPELRKRE